MDPVEFPYAPATPAKPDQPDPDMICENEPRNQFNLGSTSQLFDINGGIYNNFCMDNVETWHSISCRDLLALADATIITNGSSIADYTLQYDGLNPSTHLSIGLSSQFTPVTPDHARRAERGQVASDTIISNEEGADNDKEKSNLDEQLQPIIEQSRADNSTLVEANQDFEKGLTEGTNLNETPQPKQRRRKHRPKVVREGQPKRVRKSTTPKETYDTSTTPNPNGSSTGKRKYVRRKGVEKPTPTTPIMEETNGTIDPSPDQQTKSSCKRKINFDEPENGTEVMVEKTRVELTVDEAKTCESPSPITPSKTEVPHERSICRKAKCRINFLQETHDKGPSSIPGPHESSASASINASASTSVSLSASTERSSKTEGIRVCCESLESYLSMFTDYKSGTPLPAIFKKKRIRKGQSSITSTKENGCGLSAERNAGKAPEMSKVNGMQALGRLENSKKKRSKGLTQMSDSASYAGMMGGQWQTPEGASGYENSRQRHMYMEALAADFQVSIATKKRMKKKSSTMPSLYHNHIGCHPNLRLINIYDIDALVKEFERLDISNRVAEEDRGALVPYLSEYHDKNALVLYQRDGTLVPFEGLFNPMKKRKPRPKVDLDDETSRVWRLLLEDINSQGIDGTDEDKAKWWEEERRVFRGRADSFIARMHLVQGDRRFSRWKGSVLDSVIGVFLTQNVSDHLSSSAFMSLAARYPLKSKSSSEPLQEEKPLLSVKEPYQVDHNETINGSMMLQDAESCKEKVVNINEFSKNSTCSVGLNDNNSECEVLEIEDIVSSQNSADTSPSSVQSSIAHTIERLGSCSTHSSGEQKDGPKATVLDGYTSFVELLHMQRPTMVHEICSQGQAESMVNSPGSSTTSKPTLNRHGSGALEVEYFEMREETKIIQKKSEEKCASEESGLSVESASQARVQMVRTTSSQEIFHCEMIVENPKINTDDSNCEVQEVLDIENVLVETFEATESNNNVQKVVEFNLNDCGSNQVVNGMDEGSSKVKTVKTGKVKQIKVDWDSLRLQAEVKEKRERDPDTTDSLDYDAVMNADVNDIADAIKERGMNNVLAGRIKDLLDRLVRDHGSIDLEWLRDVPPDKAKEYLLSFRGLGLKSVECVRLLTLHHLAFPVDTNVGRIAVRLGWVPLQPLPESLQLHLLELYPVLESIQKYLWPRLCKLDQRTLYELHYQMITFGKVFCTKSKPNCNACPMRGECRHFASAFASARLGLPAPEEKVIVNAIENRTSQTAIGITNQQPLTLPPANEQLPQHLEIQICNPVIEEPASPEPIVEVPATPETEQIQQELDIEDFCEDPEEIPMIKLNIEQFTQNLQTYMEKHMELGECDMSKALVALTSEAAAIPTPKLKNVSQLRTEHQVYELPDSHPLLEGLDTREPDDPCSYLLAIWTPGETADSIQPPEGQCSSQESGTLCNEETCFFCNSTREANSQTVRGTLLIPCRTAMRGSFPLNGTYFQVNEVFADHESSLNPIDVPRSWLWNLPRRIVYFGTSIPTIFKGLTTEDIQYCFWRGFVCVRGFDQKTRAPRPLMARLHFPASKLKRSRGKTDEIKH